MKLPLSLPSILVGIFLILLATPPCSAQGGIYLSTSRDGRRLDVYNRDDGSGRQKWILKRIPKMKDVFTIKVSKGTKGGFGGEQLLSVTGDGKKFDLYSHDDNSGRQKWLLENIPGTQHFWIRVWGGVRSKYGGNYITANKNGSALFLGPKDANLRSRWSVEETDKGEPCFVIKVVGKIGDYRLRDWGWSADKKRKPLHVCQGDCDHDGHCADGLVCHHRNDYSAVPGCVGRGKKGYDYCIEPKLKDYGWGADKGRTLQLCEGDCDNDSQCAAGLKCHHRNGFNPVPGCTGMGKDGMDYCVAPTLKDFGANAHKTRKPMKLCEGDCDNDLQCAKGLVCFQRNGFTPVPGCNGLGRKNYDYCIEKPLKDYGADAHNKRRPLQLCEGDCDSDSQCASGLKCFQRSGFTRVPGCSGNGKNHYDYCIKA